MSRRLPLPRLLTAAAPASPALALAAIDPSEWTLAAAGAAVGLVGWALKAHRPAPSLGAEPGPTPPDVRPDPAAASPGPPAPSRAVEPDPEPTPPPTDSTTSGALPAAVRGAPVAEAAARRVLGGVAAQLRGRLNAVRGLSEVLLEEVTEPLFRRDVIELEATARACLEFVADLEVLADPEPGMTGRAEKTGLRAIFEASTAARPGLRDVSLGLGEEPERPLILDGAAVRRGLPELLSRLRAQRGRGEVRVRARVRDSGGHRSLRVSVEVPDSALDGEALRAELTPFGSDSGEGVQAAVAAALIRRAGGRVEVGVDAARVAHLRIELPEAEREPDADRPPRVLIVDDVRTNGLVAIHQLENLGCEAGWAGSGEEALDRLDISWDYILLDLHMPGMDGVETAEAIRDRRPDGRATLVAMTGDRSPDAIARCRAAGMSERIIKPVSSRALARLVGAEPPHAEAGQRTGAAGDSEPAEPGPPVEPEVLASLRAELGEDPEFLRELLRMFLETCAERTAALRTAVESSDAEQAAVEAHSLVTPAHSIGARGLAFLAREIEESAGRGDLDEARALLPRTLQLAEEVRARLEHELSILDPGARPPALPGTAAA